MAQSIEYRLTQWGIWARTGQGIPRCNSPMWAIMRDNVQVSYDPPANITDEDAEQIDRALGRLTLKDKDQARAVWEYYRYQGMDYRRLGQRMGISKDKAGQLVLKGVCWIDGYLDGKPEEMTEESTALLIAWCARSA